MVDLLARFRKKDSEKKRHEPIDPRLCVVDTLSSIVSSIAPEVAFNEQQQALESERIKHSVQLNTMHSKKVMKLRKYFEPLVRQDHGKHFVNMMKSLEKQEVAAYRLDRIYIQQLYQRAFAALSEVTGNKYELKFVRSDGTEDIVTHLSEGYQVAIMIRDLFNSLHIFHVGRKEDGALIDLSSRSQILGYENAEKRILALKSLNSAISTLRREFASDDKSSSTFWNTILIRPLH